MMHPTVSNKVWTLLVLASFISIPQTSAFTLPGKTVAFTSTSTSTSTCLSEQKSTNSDKDDIENENIIAKTSWYAAEALGKIFGGNGGNDNNESNNKNAVVAIDTTKTPSSLSETIERIKLDNDRFYFLSGKVDSLSYDPNCYFADPFVGFSGTERFVDNLKNLGSFITNYDVKVLNYDVTDDELEVNTRLMVKLELNLPWKPILAWPWGVKYEIDSDTFLILSHIESWDIEPLEGVKQVFRKPTLKIN